MNRAMATYINAMTRGQVAFLKGKTVFDNPYPVADPQHFEWLAGYQRAARALK